MLFESLAVVGMLLGIGVIACLTLSRVRSALSRRTATRYGRLIKRELENGDVEVIAIGLTDAGVRTMEKTYVAKALAPDLHDAFKHRQTARIEL
ncbi:hypothetical protein ABZ329_33255 [Streptomyces rubiginosohelvolus]|uniref:hypothetical protein n=1 Tax=Streptomyces TaxID=1883 RepID=UPI000BF1CB5B|nr:MULTISPECIES: hypothetical protein [unclassified Streptomyces]MZG00760.1 hypothetical protein [Streptomyces sp. SID5614]